MSKDKKTVSFIIPFLGSDISDIQKTLESLNKLEFYQGWEVLVAYETHKVSRKLYDFINHKLNYKIKIIQISIGTGLQSSLNMAIKESKSEFISRIDAGDKLFASDRVSQQIKFLNENPDYWCVGSSIRILDEKENFLRIRYYPESHYEIIKASYYINPICHSAVTFRKKEFLELGAYDEKEYNEDFALWLKAINLGYKFYNLQYPSIDYVLNSSNKGRSRSFFAVLKLRFRYLNSFTKLLTISVPVTFLQLLLFKFPKIYGFINKKFR